MKLNCDANRRLHKTVNFILNFTSRKTLNWEIGPFLKIMYEIFVHHHADTFETTLFTTSPHISFKHDSWNQYRAWSCHSCNHKPFAPSRRCMSLQPKQTIPISVEDTYVVKVRKAILVKILFGVNRIDGPWFCYVCLLTFFVIWKMDQSKIWHRNTKRHFFSKTLSRNGVPDAIVVVLVVVGAVVVFVVVVVIV